MSGTSTSWHDLILYLIAQHAGPTAAQTVAKFFAFQWHADGLAPYVIFEPVTGHGDAAIQKAQDWLSRHFSVANPIEQAARISGIAERSFKRRFKSATGHAPIDYVQRLRVEEAKRRLERTQAPWMRSAGGWVTKIRRSSAGYSSELPVSRPGRTGGSFTSPS